MNRSHLLALILARYRGAMQSRYHCTQSLLLDYLCAGRIPTERERKMCLFAKVPVSGYTLRQLRDTIHNMQVEWEQCDAVCMPGIMATVDCCFHRFGVLASVATGLDTMNDQGSIEDAGGGLFRMNNICMRRWV